MYAPMRLALSLVLIIAIGWLAIIAVFYFFQEKFVFYPSRGLGPTPADIGLAYRDVYLYSDGLKLHGWYVPAPAARAQVLFLHGNAGNISHRLDTLKMLYGLGLSSLIIDYRGYGRSEGRPTEAGTRADALAAWAYLRAQGIGSDAIIIMGRSLGGAVAAQLVAALAPAERPAALILDSTFTSLDDMARHHYGFLPVGLIGRMRYDSEQALAVLRAPLLLIHSRDDEIVPYAQGRRLYTAADTNKTFITTAGRHNASFSASRKQYAAAIADLLDRVFPEKAISGEPNQGD